MKNRSVYGVFTSRASAANALDELKAAKFSSSDIKVLSSPPTGVNQETEIVPVDLSKIAAGITLGATLGGLVGFLMGVSQGVQVFPIAALEMIPGPIVNALAGAGVGGLVGGIIASLVTIGLLIVKKKVKGQIKTGGFLILASAPNTTLAERGRDILKKNHAQDVCVTTV